MKTPIEMIAEERQLQIECWGNAHDDEHDDGKLAMAAASYALLSAGFSTSAITHWPFQVHEFKPDTEHVRALVKAGALIVAEIERLQRL